MFSDGEPCGTSPNILVDGDIDISAGGDDDSELQFEEGLDMKAGGDITLTGNGKGSQVQTKRDVILTAGSPAGAGGEPPAVTGNITVTAPDVDGEVQAEDDNIWTAHGMGNITLQAGDSGAGDFGKLNVKTGTVLDAGGGTLTLESGGECKIETIQANLISTAEAGSCLPL